MTGPLGGAIRPRAPALRLLLVAGLAACASSTGKPGAATPDGHGERDTELKHETCDGNSSSATKTDANGDGKPDITHVRSGGREVCRIVDLNLDGAPDSFIYYDEAGKERRRESDFDRDGRPDEIVFLSGGVVVRKERETNYDNKIDTWDYYDGGRLARRERDSDGDKIIDQWWQFNNPSKPACAVVASDRNADGKPDPDGVVDLCGESYGAPPSAPAPAAPGSSTAAAGSASAPTAAASAPGAPPAPSAPSAAASATPASASASAAASATPSTKK